MLPKRIADLRSRYNECFGCGIDNPIGLHMDGFHVVGGVVRAGFSPKPDHHGFSELLHGGVVATALDEIMAWTAILIEGVMVMTATLQLRFRSPAHVNSTFTMEGEVVERRGKRLKLNGRMTDSGVVVAEASGLFVVIEDLTAS
jgi:acyl-coenzyme A thioesterase PaaI-like protein